MRAGRAPVAAALAAVLVVACADGGTDPVAAPSSATPSPPVQTETATPEPTPTPTPTPEPTFDPAPDPRTSYASAAAAAEVLVQAEAVLRDPEVVGPVDEPFQHLGDHVVADHVADWAWVQQAIYRQLADRPEWDDEVLAVVPEDWHEDVRDHLLANRELRRLTKARTELPPWRIIDPPASVVLVDAYKTAADEFGIDWTYLAAIHLSETRMGRIEGDSTAGARGPMQFLPSTWEAYGQGDITDPHDAIRAAAFYLADHGAPQDMDGALWAYNHSDRYVEAVKAHARIMQRDERAYHAFHGWQVYYRLESGDQVLEVGYDGR